MLLLLLFRGPLVSFGVLVFFFSSICTRICLKFDSYPGNTHSWEEDYPYKIHQASVHSLRPSAYIALS